MRSLLTEGEGARRAIPFVDAEDEKSIDFDRRGTATIPTGPELDQKVQWVAVELRERLLRIVSPCRPGVDRDSRVDGGSSPRRAGVRRAAGAGRVFSIG